MTLRTIRRFMVDMGTQFQTVYVNCRTAQGGETCIRRLHPECKTVTFQEASDSFGYDYRSDEMDEIKTA